MAGRCHTSMYRYEWLTVKANTITGSRELGIFADRKFNSGKFITAYFGKPAGLTGDVAWRVIMGRRSVDVTVCRTGVKSFFLEVTSQTVPTGIYWLSKGTSLSSIIAINIKILCLRVFK